MTRTSMRLFTTALLTGAFVFSAALPAMADAELDDLLEDIEESEFSGTQIIITTWDGVTEVSVVVVDHNSDITTVEGGAGVTMLGRGRVLRSGAGSGAAVSVWTDVDSDRYRLVVGKSTVRRGREVQNVAIHEGSMLRARLTIDVESGAPLVTEIFDGSGRRFRYSAMLDFDPWSRGGLNRPAPLVFDMSTPVENYQIGAVAGYERADTYSSPDESVYSFFSDGLFSFSLFEFDREANFGDDDTLEAFESNGANYHRRVTATEIYVTWQSGGQTFVLVGDLPPDHLAAVLDGLPQPRDRGLFSRIWSGVFG